MTQQNKKTSSKLQVLIIISTFSRLIINTSRRFVYPFASVLAHGMGVPLTAITNLIAINQATSLLAIFFGPMADRFGYRMMMLIGLGLLIVGMMVGGMFPYYWVIAISLFLAGLAKNVFDPAIQAYIGEHVPFESRGRVLGIIEVCWAGSTLIGIPIIAICIDLFGWRSPFFLLGGLGLFGWLILRRLFKSEPPIGPGSKNQHQSTVSSWIGILGLWRKLFRERTAFFVLGASFLIGISADNLFVVYGVWLQNSFDLSIIELGASTSIIGVAELSGTTLVAIVGDRIGLSRSVRLGVLLNIICCAMLIVLDNILVTALIGLFIIFMTFEFSIVSIICLSTELIPDARATMMSALLVVASLGRIFGALVGLPIWQTGGIALTCLTSAMIGACGLTLLLIGLWGYRVPDV